MGTLGFELAVDTLISSTIEFRRDGFSGINHD
jgi:hypothetical protein